MEKIKSMLECNNVNINDLVVEDWGDRFHIGFRSKTPVINSGASDVKVLVETLDKEGNYTISKTIPAKLEFDNEEVFKKEILRIINNGGIIGKVWIKEENDDYKPLIRL